MRSVGFALTVVVALYVVGARANADAVDPSAGSPAAVAVAKLAGQVDTAANAGAAETSADDPAADAAVPPARQVDATESGQQEKKKRYLSVAYYAFFPTDGDTKRNFGKAWNGFGIGIFHTDRPNMRVISWSFSALSKHGPSDALLVPVTVGVQHGLTHNPDRQCYVAVRVGPYYGKVDDNLKGPDESKIGGCANVAVGVVIDRRFLIEARYDWFTKLAGNNFNGLTLTAGVKVSQFSF